MIQACKQDKNNAEIFPDNNKGKLDISAESNYRQLATELIKSYENVYDSAEIRITFMEESKVLNSFMNDSIRMMILGRMLTDKEISFIEQKQRMKPQQHIIAYDAIAIIKSTRSSDSIFDLDAFIENKKNGVKNRYAHAKFVFEKGSSTTLNSLLIKTGIRQDALANMFSTDSLQTQISYIEKDTNAIGFLSFALVSDLDDPAVKDILSKVKILSIKYSKNDSEKLVAELSQSTLATQEYPLVQPINIVMGNTNQRLGVGFINFLFKSKSARIFLKSGLVPAQIPERQLLIKTE